MATNSGTSFSYVLSFDESSENLSKKKIYLWVVTLVKDKMWAYHSLLLELMEPLTCI